MNDWFSLIYSPESIDDLRDIFAYISVALAEPIIARKQVDRIRTAIKTLNQLPLRNPLVEWEPWLTDITEILSILTTAFLFNLRFSIIGSSFHCLTHLLK